MKISNSYLDTLASSHDKILVFDCEFWHVFGSSGFIPIDVTRNEFFMPREVGGFILQKTKDGQWSYKKEFFVTLHPPKGKDVSFVSSEYSSVTSKTADLMDAYQGVLSKPWASSFLNTLPEEQHGLLLEDIKLYLNDPNIKQAHKPPSWLKTFINEYKDSLIVVKGDKDIDALKNACKVYDIPYSPPKNVIDIAEWNITSRRKCGTARLDGTYKCVKPLLASETKELLKILPIGEAHDPLSDAAMTLIVALYIIQREE